MSYSVKLSRAELEAVLREMGAKRYHHLHPFHQMLHSGACTRPQVEAWALNRYVYQATIPIKDASLIARCEDPAVRRIWRKRLEDQDGGGSTDHAEGGLSHWLVLTDGLGLDRQAVVSQTLALPATRYATAAYVHFVRERSLLEAIASALTELFSPQIISERLEGMLTHYDYITSTILAYFHHRPPQAERDSDFALEYVLQHATTPRTQAAVISALSFKLDLLWAMLDALYAAYVTPGLIPPGAFVSSHRA